MLFRQLTYSQMSVWLLYWERRDIRSYMTRKPISSPAFKYISGVRRITEVYFQLFTLKKLYIFGVEDDSLCIYCQENESTMYLVEWFKKKKWFNNKNAFAFSPTGFSQNFHLRKSLSRQILQQKLWVSPSSFANYYQA